MEPLNLSNKPLDNLSIEDLLKALENSPQNDSKDTVVEDTQDFVLAFIERFKLESGEHRVESRLLWNLYLQYYPKTITRNVFTEKANKLLKYSKAVFFVNISANTLMRFLLNPKKSVVKKTPTIAKHTVHFLSFLENKVATAGEHKIPWYAFYHVYRCYCIDNKIKHRSKQTFLSFMKLHFKTVTSDDGSLFLVNKEIAHSIEKKDYERLKKLYQKESFTKR